MTECKVAFPLQQCENREDIPTGNRIIDLEVVREGLRSCKSCDNGKKINLAVLAASSLVQLEGLNPTAKQKCMHTRCKKNRKYPGSSKMNFLVCPILLE